MNSMHKDVPKMNRELKQDDTGSTKLNPEADVDQENIVSCEEPKTSAQKRLSPKNTEEEYSDSDSGSDVPSPKKMPKKKIETDPAIIAKREKQIEYGKNTVGYENYIKLIPKAERRTADPKTPPKFGKYSRRAWDGLIKQWRIKLHRFDTDETDS